MIERRSGMAQSRIRRFFQLFYKTDFQLFKLAHVGFFLHKFPTYTAVKVMPKIIGNVSGITTICANQTSVNDHPSE